MSKLFLGAFALAVFLQAGAAMPQQGGRKSTNGRGGAKQQQLPHDAAHPEVLVTFEGKVSSHSDKEIVLGMEGDNTLSFRVSKKTILYDGDKNLKVSALKDGDRISIDANRGIDGSLEAVNILLRK